MKLKKALIIVMCLLAITSIVSAGKVNYTRYHSRECTGSTAPQVTCQDKLTINTVTKYDILIIGDDYCYKPDYRNFVVPVHFLICHWLVAVEDDMCYFRNNISGNDPPVECKYIAWHIVNVEKNIYRNPWG